MFWLDLTSNGIKRPQNFQLAPFNMIWSRRNNVRPDYQNEIIQMKLLKNEIFYPSQKFWLDQGADGIVWERWNWK